MKHPKEIIVTVPLTANSHPNTKDFARIAETGTDVGVEALLSEFSLPLFMLRDIKKRKDLTDKVRQLAGEGIRERQALRDAGENY